MKLLRWIELFFVKDELAEIVSLKAQVSDLTVAYNNKQKDIDALYLTTNKYKAIINDLEAEQSEVEDISELEEYWNTKYTSSALVYKGRPLPLKNANVDIPINILITPNDPFIKKDLIKWGLYETGEDAETLVPKIYKKIKSNYYKYAFDKATWGVTELWEFPFEVRAARVDLGLGVDCDSWSHFMASYYIAAGIPNWQVHVVVGNTSLGGHSTIYVYSKHDYNWHHINSTYGAGWSKTRVSSYPTHADAEAGKDKIGISKVWFSFNNEFSWYKFVSDIPKELQEVK